MKQYRYVHMAVLSALRAGELQRSEKCERCGTTDKKLHAHHDDYTKPLQVRWLCISCHRFHHAENPLPLGKIDGTFKRLTIDLPMEDFRRLREVMWKEQRQGRSASLASLIRLAVSDALVVWEKEKAA